MKHAEILYYTGTGNTIRALDIVAASLKTSGWTVTLTDIASGTLPEAIGTGDLLIVGYPTLGFSAPASLFPVLRALPRPNSTAGTPAPEAVILAACGASLTKKGTIAKGWSGVSTFVVGKLLQRRGYRFTASAEISYTENWTQITEPLKGEARDRATQLGDSQAAAFGKALAEGQRPMIKRGIAGKAFGYPVGWLFKTIAHRVLAKLFAADASCTGCGLCARTCPAHAITMEYNRPAWDQSCTACNRCINLCPTRSIQTPVARLVLVLGANFAILAASRPLALLIISVLETVLQGITGIQGASGILPGAASGSAAGIPQGSGLTASTGGLPLDIPGTVRWILTHGLTLFVYLGGTLFQTGPGDRILRAMERSQLFSPLFKAAHTRSFSRYLAPGFSPAQPRNSSLPPGLPRPTVKP